MWIPWCVRMYVVHTVSTQHSTLSEHGATGLTIRIRSIFTPPDNDHLLHKKPQPYWPYLQQRKFFALVAAASATQFSSMNEDELLAQLSSHLESAMASESRGDSDAAVAKTAAIKNIQKSLTARILKRLDDGQPLVEVARKMKAIEGMQP